jgi:hypothetical protein
VTGEIVKVTVTAKNNVRTDDRHPPARHWVLMGVPSKDDVLIKDSEARQKFLGALEIFDASSSTCPNIILDGQPTDRCGFVAHVSIPEIHLNFSIPAEILKRRRPACRKGPSSIGFKVRGIARRPLRFDGCVSELRLGLLRE